MNIYRLELKKYKSRNWERFGESLSYEAAASVAAKRLTIFPYKMARVVLIHQKPNERKILMEMKKCMG